MHKPVAPALPVIVDIKASQAPLARRDRPLAWSTEHTGGRPVTKFQAVLGHSLVVMRMDVYGHLFTRAEDDVELFEKLEQDLVAP